jgi:hypothetical protein
MKGYVARKGDRWYAVVYEGLDPVTGKEKRSWHPAGTSRVDAERLASSLAAKLNGRNDEGRSLTFGACLLARWLPGKKLELAHSTWDGYRRKIERHVIPSLGKVSIRRLRPHHLERLYDEKLHPGNGKRPLAPKTVLEIHLIIRGALNDAASGWDRDPKRRIGGPRPQAAVHLEGGTACVDSSGPSGVSA